jgi:alanine racemase
MGERRGILRKGLRGPVGVARPEVAPPRPHRPTWAAIDLDALAHNTAVLRRLAAPASLCAVVKADGYGHGAPETARAALGAGASGLAVALVEEAVQLRDEGITDPVLLLSEPPPDSFDAAVTAGVTPTLYSIEGVRRAAGAARNFGTRLSVHVKVDTGMHRVGADEADVPAIVEAIVADPSLLFEGLWTHLAVADGPGEEDRDFTRLQLARFDGVIERLSGHGRRPSVVHAANSAATMFWPTSRYNLVRCGIALYGGMHRAPMHTAGDEGPGPGSPAGARPMGTVATMPPASLRPVLSLHARVSAVRELDAGERPSYGRLRPLAERSVVATVPLGYADGLPRALFGAGYAVLIGGRRCPLAGAVTMDQIVVDCGPHARVAPGDEVVLLGAQGDDEVTAEEWADLLGTISYEVLCGIGPRVRRVYSGNEDAQEWRGPRDGPR